MKFVCKTVDMMPWGGYYGRIPGQETVFHVDLGTSGDARPYVILRRGSESIMCRMIRSNGAFALGRAVDNAKKEMSGKGGGSFVVTPWGEVLVPANDHSRKVSIVARVEGSFRFENPFGNGPPIDLSDVSGLSPGDPWDRPYVGVPYQVSPDGELFCWRRDEDQRERVSIDGIIGHILWVRAGCRGGRFIVNPSGVVLKKERIRTSRGEAVWSPVFMMKLPDKLFEGDRRWP